MDRFIGLGVRLRSLLSSDLKSNMDRFIDQHFSYILRLWQYLKSNMDRFIVFTDDEI